MTNFSHGIIVQVILCLEMLNLLIDSFDRRITYLRLSVTDRCNLRCRYCMPEDGVDKLNHRDILTYEEFLRIVRAAASEGMTKVRLTGGEPLVRKGILDFIKQLYEIDGLADLRLTTNGVLLADMAEDLLDAGVKRVNISLDSLKRDVFEKITGRDYLHNVLAGIEKAIDIGFDKIKINCVPIRGWNDDEISDFARLSITKPLEIRFIEFMPLGDGGFWSPDKVVSFADIKEMLTTNLGPMKSLPRKETEGPARVYKLPDSKGEIGFISPVTDHFCETCNRLRLTADGKLRLCLLSKKEIDIKQKLRSGADLDELKELLKTAVNMKPGRHILQEDIHTAEGRTMNRIGG